VAHRTCGICGKPHVARGWCRRHYYAWTQHGDPLALEWVAGPAPPPTFVCEGCGRTFERRSQMGPMPRFCDACKRKAKRHRTDAWHSDPANRDAVLRHKRRAETILTRACADCGAPFTRIPHASASRWCGDCKASRERKRKQAAALRHRCHAKGITVAQYQAALTVQDGRCAICRREFGDEAGPPHIDHDHACCPGAKSCGRCFRGLLCTGCNHSLGNLHDDIKIILAAARYVLNGGAGRPPPNGDARAPRADQRISGLVLPGM
jgi:Recombination endonuclease VII